MYALKNVEICTIKFQTSLNGNMSLKFFKYAIKKIVFFCFLHSTALKCIPVDKCWVIEKRFSPFTLTSHTVQCKTKLSVKKACFNSATKVLN